jgi:hypothetical protein
MIKILGVEIVQSMQIDDWCSDVVSFNPTCSWSVDGVVYWLQLTTSVHQASFRTDLTILIHKSLIITKF